MTHPDIEKIEKLGCLNPTDYAVIGDCRYCGSPLYDDGFEHTKSMDGLFCDIDCCHEFYSIEAF